MLGVEEVSLNHCATMHLLYPDQFAQFSAFYSSHGDHVEMLVTIAPELEIGTAFRVLLQSDPALGAFYRAVESFNQQSFESIGVPLGVLISHSHFPICDGEVVVEFPETGNCLADTGQRVLARVRPVVLREQSMSGLIPRSIVRLGRGKFLVYELLRIGSKSCFDDWTEQLLSSEALADLDAHLPDEYLPYSIFVNYYQEFGKWITAEDKAGPLPRERVMVQYKESIELV